MAEKKKKATKARRKQCSVKGCRKFRVNEAAFCAKHRDEANQGLNPLENVKRLSEMDRLRFIEIDSAMRSEKDRITILTLEHSKDQKDFEARTRTRQAGVEQARAAIDARKGEYTTLMSDFAAKYSFDLKDIAINDRTGVIQDLKKKSDDG